MKLNELIKGLQKFQETYGDIPVVMDEDGKGDVCDSVAFGDYAGNCSISVIDENDDNNEHWLGRLEFGTKLPVLLINISF